MSAHGPRRHDVAAHLHSLLERCAYLPLLRYFLIKYGLLRLGHSPAISLPSGSSSSKPAPKHRPQPDYDRVRTNRAHPGIGEIFIRAEPGAFRGESVGQEYLFLINDAGVF